MSRPVSSILRLAIEKIKTAPLDIAIGLIVAGLPGVLLSVEDFLKTFVPKLSPGWTVRLYIALISGLAWLGFLLWQSKPWLKFDSRLGIYVNKRSGHFYCTSCHSKKRFSPLRTEKDGWRCMVRGCDQFYQNPHYRPPRSKIDPMETGPWP